MAEYGERGAEPAIFAVRTAQYQIYPSGRVRIGPKCREGGGKRNVEILQRQIVELGGRLPCDGLFDGITEERVAFENVSTLIDQRRGESPRLHPAIAIGRRSGIEEQISACNGVSQRSDPW
jgi:hypothetical protein